ncbi:MAG: azoB 1 [Chitinophagaceae bacterium]|nr:azoB 1 [Chitinophagaceae bacterium]
MKIILTGSLGHISQPLTRELVQQGHAVTVISSNSEKQKAIEALGATAAIGSIEDLTFLTATFTGADAVYTMLPPPTFFDHNFDLMAHCRMLGNNYAQSIQQSGVKRVVHLSSIGAHLDKDSGLILMHHELESILKKLSDVAITFMRPVAFHYNLLAFLPLIKNTGRMSSNYGAGDKVAWVAPADIAAAIADEIVTPITGRKVRYVASDELTCNEVASILGAAIGKPDLKWILITNEEMQNRLEGIGLNPRIAAGLVEMQSSMHNGEFFQDYYLNRPTVMGKVKLNEFAKEFAAAFHQQ